MVCVTKNLIVIWAVLIMIFASGCGGDKNIAGDLKGVQNSSINYYSPSEKNLNNYFVENKFKAAVESKDVNCFNSLYNDAFICERFYNVNFHEILNNINDIKFEVLSSEVIKSKSVNGEVAAQDGRSVIYYKMAGYNGNDYEEFIKRGVLDLSVKIFYIENESRNDVKISGDFASQYYHLKGKISAVNGEKLSNARVSIKTAKYEYCVTTYADGFFLIDFVNEQQVVIKVEKAGYKTFESEKINLKMGEILDIGNIAVAPDEKYAGTRYLNADNAENADTSENGFFYENKTLKLNERLFATAYDGRVSIDFEKIVKEYAGFDCDYRAILYRKEKDGAFYEKIGETFKVNFYEDKNVVNGKCYFYKVEIRLQNIKSGSSNGIEKILAGPVMAIPSSFSLRMEFEKMLLAGMKFKGDKPEIVNDSKYSSGAYIAFSPELTGGISFLTPAKIKTGSYKVILCAKKLERNVMLNIKIKQFGDTDGEYFMNKTIDLKSISNQDDRELIELGDILIEPKNWRNEVIAEDFDDVIISVEQVSGNGAKDKAASSKSKVCLDLMEFIKKD